MIIDGVLEERKIFFRIIRGSMRRAIFVFPLLLSAVGAVWGQDIAPVWTVDLPAAPGGAPFVRAGRVFQPLTDGTLLSADLETGGGVETPKVAAGFVGGVTPWEDGAWWAEPGGRVVHASLPGGETLQVWDLPEEPHHEPQPAGRFFAVGAGSSLYLLEPGRDGPAAVLAMPGKVSARPSAWRQRLAVPVAPDEGGGLLLLLDLDRPGAPPVGRFRLEGAPGSPALRGGDLYVGDEAGHFSAYRFRGGPQRGARRIWRRRTGGPVMVPPVTVLGGVAWVSLDNWIYYVDARDGLPRSMTRSPRRVSRPMVELGGGLMVLSPEGSRSLLEVDLFGGKMGRSWSAATEGDLVLTPPARDPEARWLLASFGPWAWRLAAFDLRAYPEPAAEGEGEAGDAPAVEGAPERDEGEEGAAAPTPGPEDPGEEGKPPGLALPESDG